MRCSDNPEIRYSRFEFHQATEFGSFSMRKRESVTFEVVVTLAHRTKQHNLNAYRDVALISVNTCESCFWVCYTKQAQQFNCPSLLLTHSSRYLSRCLKMSNHFNRQIEQLSNLIAHVNFMQIFITWEFEFSTASIEWRRKMCQTHILEGCAICWLDTSNSWSKKCWSFQITIPRTSAMETVNVLAFRLNRSMQTDSIWGERIRMRISIHQVERLFVGTFRSFRIWLFIRIEFQMKHSITARCNAWWYNSCTFFQC